MMFRKLNNIWFIIVKFKLAKLALICPDCDCLDVGISI